MAENRIRRAALLGGLLILLLVFGASAEEEPATQTDLNPVYTAEGDVLTEWLDKEAKAVIIPEGIREIAPGAFRDLKNLETVVLPDTLEKIGREAFAGCEKLETVVLGEKSALEEIGNRAFYQCKKLDAGFVPEQVTVAEDAFEGAKETARPTEKPTKEPEKTTPTPTPVPEDHKPPEAETPTPEPEDDPVPGGWGGGGGGGGFSMSRVTHQRYTGRITADYDALYLKDLKDEAEKIMERLTLGGESLALTLAGEDGGESAFTVYGMDWAEPGGAAVDTLILTAEETAAERGTWHMNGEVLRRMRRSGVEHLVLRCGDRIAVMETEGFLAGWAYDAMKSRGTANRRFEYEIGMDGENPAVWRVTVEGQVYELTEDEHAGIYLTGVYSGPAEALDNPYEAWLEEERSASR